MERAPRPAPEPSPPPPRTGTGETLRRVLWVLPWIAFVIVIVVTGGLVFALPVIGFAIIGQSEYFRMTRRARPFHLVAYAAAAALVLAAYYGSHYQLVLVLVATFPVMFLVALTRDDRRRVAYSIAVTVFAIAWIAIPLAHAVLLRELPDHGAALLVDVLVATFVSDTSAYAAGRLFGRRPLAPSLSPSKTVEGFVGGLIGGTMGFWFAGLYQDWLPGLDALIMGISIALLTPLGDLFESMIKRDLAIKDTGNLFGPHGGVLDRLDAVLFTLVGGYYLSVAFVY